MIVRHERAVAARYVAPMLSATRHTQSARALLNSLHEYWSSSVVPTRVTGHEDAPIDSLFLEDTHIDSFFVAGARSSGMTMHVAPIASRHDARRRCSWPRQGPPLGEHERGLWS
jgi:hypothetical protein